MFTRTRGARKVWSAYRILPKRRAFLWSSFYGHRERRCFLNGTASGSERSLRNRNAAAWEVSIGFVAAGVSILQGHGRVFPESE